MCFHPNIIIQDRDVINPNTGNNWQIIKFINGRSKDFKGYEYWDQFNYDPKRNMNGKLKASRVPCQNQCIQCCENKAKENAFKCMYEATLHEENYMITLTYNDTNLPIASHIETSEWGTFYDDGTWNSFLRYEDARNFIRKVRDWQRNSYNIDGIRFFGCGEYGGKEGRAHFHIILFGLHIDPNDVKIHSIDKEGNVLYECEELAKCWTPLKANGKYARRGEMDPMGFVSVAECNWQTCRYVAGYVQKKQIKTGRDEYEFFTNKEVYYARRGQIPERLFMSNHPGLGKGFYEKSNMFFEDGYILAKGAKEKIVKAKIPRYFEKLLENEHPLMLEKYKDQKRTAAEKAEKVKMSQTSLSIKEQLEVEERIKKDQMLIFNLRDKVG